MSADDDELASWSVGKRSSTDEPLTAHDVAERLGRSVMRTLRILTDARELGLAREVASSRYLASGLLDALADELQAWRAEVER